MCIHRTHERVKLIPKKLISECVHQGNFVHVACTMHAHAALIAGSSSMREVRTWERDVTSAAHTSTWPSPLSAPQQAWTSDLAVSSLLSVRATSVTRAPSAATSLAMASPVPSEPPVIRTCFALKVTRLLLGAMAVVAWQSASQAAVMLG